MRTYVGTIDSNLDRPVVAITDVAETPEVGEIVALLDELSEVSAMRHLGRPHPDPERHAPALEHKRGLLDRIRAADSVPSPRPLPHLAIHSPDGFDWGYRGNGPADLARAILHQELAEDVPAEVYLPFRDQVVARLPAEGFNLPASDVWDWIRANRTLVDRHVFGVEADHPVPAVVNTDDPSSGGDPGDHGAELTEPTASKLIEACESAWTDIRTRHPELPEVVVILGSGVERGRLVKLGHWWGGRWIADGQARGEVLLAGEALHLEPRQVFEVLLHESAHGINAARGVKDTSRGGRYHNEKFATTAREVGLDVKAMPPYGMARTELTPDTASAYASTIERVGDAMRIARQLDGIGGAGAERESDGAGPGTTGKEGAGRSRNAPLVTCGCDRKMRMHESVLAQGPVICGLCKTEFTTGASVRRNEQPEQDMPANVDDTFQSRRREALRTEALENDRRSVEAERARIAEQLEDPGAWSDGTGPYLQDRLDGLDAALVELGVEESSVDRGVDRRSAEGRDKRVEGWYRHLGTLHEQPMVGSDPDEVERLTTLARRVLRRHGALRGPDLDLGPLDVAAGDRLIVQEDLADGPPPGTPGSVLAVDVERGACAVDFATWGTLDVGCDSEHAAALAHDYAVVAHAAAMDRASALQAERELALTLEPEP